MELSPPRRRQERLLDCPVPHYPIQEATPISARLVLVSLVVVVAALTAAGVNANGAAAQTAATAPAGGPYHGVACVRPGPEFRDDGLPAAVPLGRRLAAA